MKNLIFRGAHKIAQQERNQPDVYYLKKIALIRKEEAVNGLLF
jgi:hypothetical protein